MSVDKKTYLQSLEKQRGRIVILSVGSGLHCKLALESKTDMILTSSDELFFQMGTSSLAMLFPNQSSNRTVYEFSMREILPLRSSIPIIFGICAYDPLIDLEAYIAMLHDVGFSGICNIPTLSIIDGEYRKYLTHAGITFQREIDAIRIANKLGMITIAVVKNEKEAEEMLDAGCDFLSFSCGLTKDGSPQSMSSESFISELVMTANSIFDVVEKKRSGVYKLLYGGPVKESKYLNRLLKSTNADGFIGSYIFEGILRKALQNFPGKEFFFSMSEGVNENNTYIEYIMSYIQTHYMEKILLEDLARDCFVSRPYLSSLFKEEMGMTFSEYLINYRLKKAFNMLISTDFPITIIAENVGYPNYPAFEKLFRKKVGMTPGAYRRNQKNNKSF